MADRQDIDALLIGALYGELAPADEARLQAHLESHPADRTVLADLTHAREAVRESRILTVQLEPPQAISNVLLQEAARRAPKPARSAEEREGWLQRLVRIFTSYPVMAAATMLVLVVGIAGSMYLSGGPEQFPEERADMAAPPPATEAVAGAPGDGLEQDMVRESEKLQRNAGSGYTATLADEETLGGGGDRGVSTPPAAAPPKGADKKSRPDTAAIAKEARPRPDAAGGEGRTRTYLELQAHQRPRPKDLDDAPTRRMRREPAKPTVAPRRSVAAAAAENDVTRPPRAPSAGARAPTAGASAPAGRATGTAQIATDERVRPKENLAWARSQHDRVRLAVSNKNCREAGRLAVQISSRAPSYYHLNVETDRALKQCMPRINAARESMRLRAKHAADEAAPPAVEPPAAKPPAAKPER